MNAGCKTKEYYSKNHKEYIQSTEHTDMTEHYNRFLACLKRGARILDVGFGSGRDMLYFDMRGYEVLGIDNVPEFVDHAKKSGLQAELADFHDLPYVEEFDGAWACASLLHAQNLLLALENVVKAIKQGGYIYFSMKYGQGVSVEHGRFYRYVDEEMIKELCSKVGLEIVERYILKDKMQRETSWINLIARK